MKNAEILMFSGPGCHACTAMKPIMEGIPHSRVVDVTEEHELAARYGIRGGLPVFIKILDGAYADRVSGAMPKNKFIDWCRKQ